MADANADIHRRINELIDEEHHLRGDGAAPSDLDDADRRRRLAELEMQLDQAWDLLRQRQARREWDQDPTRARERPTRVVENYEN
jgi:GntR family transcriptional regulator/MocR family aminotransferase